MGKAATISDKFTSSMQQLSAQAEQTTIWKTSGQNNTAMARLTMHCRTLSAASMAGQLAGFNVLHIINETTVAALAYGLDKLASEAKRVY